MPNIPFVSQNRTALTADNIGQWENATPMSADIVRGMETPDMKINSPQAKEVISGISSIWGRALLFKYAFQHLSVQGAQQDNGLLSFFSAVIKDWKGLLTFIALESVNRGDTALDCTEIELLGSDLGEGVSTNTHELKKGLGELLFEDKPLWRNENGVPFLHIIHYTCNDGTKVVLGATSPYTIFFTPANNQYINKGLRFFNEATERWDNPMEGNKYSLSFNELHDVHDYVNNILTYLNNFAQAITLDAGTTTALRAILSGFKQEIVAKLRRDFGGRDRDITALTNAANARLINTPSLFAYPFNILLVAKSELRWDGNDRFYRFAPNDPIIDGQKFISAEALLAPADTIIRIDAAAADLENNYFLSSSQKIDNNGVLQNVLPHYYVIPLSEWGIRIFNDVQAGQPNGRAKLNTLLNNADIVQGINHKLSAVRLENDTRLKVTLRIEYSSNANQNVIAIYEHHKIYNIRTDAMVTNKTIITWPNFVSPQWNKYFLFSEYPHNDTRSNIHIKPLIAKDTTTFNVLTRPVVVGNNQQDVIDYRLGGVIVPHHIDNPYKTTYEIYRSDLPFVGVEFSYGVNQKVVSGYIVHKHPTSQTKEHLAGVTLAVDFGSNNTCIAKQDNVGNISLITLDNRRRFLLGKENNNNETTALTNELFFFQNDKANGQMKSMFMLHEGNVTQNIRRGQATAGNLVFERNIPIEESNGVNTYILTSQKQLKHSLKWLQDPTQMDFLMGFLNTLLLNIEAELFDADIAGQCFNQIKIAYPDAMAGGMASITATWNTILNNIQLIPETESKAVAYFATNGVSPTGNLVVGTNSLAIGLDVGGSTTDMFFLKKVGNNQTILCRQNSLMIAANSLALFMKDSAHARTHLAQFLQNNPLLQVPNGIRQDNVVFVLNAILDILYERDELQRLYNHFIIGDVASAQIFGITAFTTGFLLYYAGKVAAKESQDLVNPSYQIGCYGKGSNIFNWLLARNNQATSAYYQHCFLAGLGIQEGQPPRIHFTPPSRQHNKMEVVYGLLIGQRANFLDPGNNQNPLIGEEGYKIGEDEVAAFAEADSNFFSNLNPVVTPPTLESFDAFLEIYFDFCARNRFFSPTQIQAMRACQSQIPDRIIDYITSHPEYRKAENAQTFEFKTSLLAMEAACFFDNGILTVIQ